MGRGEGSGAAAADLTPLSGLRGRGGSQGGFQRCKVCEGSFPLLPRSEFLMLELWNEGKNRRERESVNQLDPTPLSRSLRISLLPTAAPGADLALRTWLSHPKIPRLMGRSPPTLRDAVKG